MAKEIDISKVTGGSNAPVPPKKPARVDPSGYRPPDRQVNALPLGDGQIVRSKSATSNLTPQELMALEGVGWKAGDPIPDHVEMAALAARQEAIEPPLPMDTPRYVVETVDISQLDPAEQVRILTGKPSSANPPKPVMPDLSGVLQRPPAAATTPKPVAQVQPPPRRNPLLDEVPMAAPQQVAQAQPGDLEIEDDLADRPQPAQPAQPQVIKKASPEMPTMGQKELLRDCPHCGWDLGMADIPEPSKGEKQAFLQSVIGQRSFIREYELLGGALKVRFRTLATREIDLIYKQVMYEQRHHMIPTIEDYWEKINRYRLYLQMLRIESPGADGFIHDLPDGYSTEHNAKATAVWKLGEHGPEETGLPQIEAYLLQAVFPSEVLQRTINNTCGRFNRLVAKLEAMVDNSDFWKATGEQS